MPKLSVSKLLLLAQLEIAVKLELTSAALAGVPAVNTYGIVKAIGYPIITRNFEHETKSCQRHLQQERCCRFSFL